MGWGGHGVSERVSAAGWYCQGGMRALPLVQHGVLRLGGAPPPATPLPRTSGGVLGTDTTASVTSRVRVLLWKKAHSM